MDDFNLPDRLEPVAPTGPVRQQEFSSDRRSPRDQKPVPPKVQDDDDGDPPQDDEDLHKVDENA